MKYEYMFHMWFCSLESASYVVKFNCKIYLFVFHFSSLNKFQFGILPFRMLLKLTPYLQSLEREREKDWRKTKSCLHLSRFLFADKPTQLNNMFHLLTHFSRFYRIFVFVSCRNSLPTNLLPITHEIRRKEKTVFTSTEWKRKRKKQHQALNHLNIFSCNIFSSTIQVLHSSNIICFATHFLNYERTILRAI